jgi:hypothetical protein
LLIEPVHGGAAKPTPTAMIRSGSLSGTGRNG